MLINNRGVPVSVVGPGVLNGLPREAHLFPRAHTFYGHLNT